MELQKYFQGYKYCCVFDTLWLSKHMHVRLIGDSKLTLGVTVSVQKLFVSFVSV